MIGRDKRAIKIDDEVLKKDIEALIGSAIIAIGLITGSVNTVVFTSWVEQFLIKELKPGQVVIMDNASFHKGKDMEKMLKDLSHSLLYLPPYS